MRGIKRAPAVHCRCRVPFALVRPTQRAAAECWGCAPRQQCRIDELPRNLQAQRTQTAMTYLLKIERGASAAVLRRFANSPTGGSNTPLLDARALSRVFAF